MSRSTLSILAIIVTLGGLAAVVWAARLVVRLAPARAKLLAVSFILAYGGVLIFQPSPWPVIDLAVLLGAIGGIMLMEGRLSTPGAVVVFLLTAAVVDVLSVSGGLTNTLIENYQNGTSDFIVYLTLVVPIADGFIPIVGISDLFIGGTAAAALLRLEIKPLPVAGALTIGLLCALAYGLWQGGAPALPFIAVPVLLLVWRHDAKSG